MGMIITTRGNYIRDRAIPAGYESRIEVELQVDEVGCRVLDIYFIWMSSIANQSNR
jgi:hypothetical protein